MTIAILVVALIWFVGFIHHEPITRIGKNGLAEYARFGRLAHWWFWSPIVKRIRMTIYETDGALPKL